MANLEWGLAAALAVAVAFGVTGASGVAGRGLRRVAWPAAAAVAAAAAWSATEDSGAVIALAVAGVLSAIAVPAGVGGAAAGAVAGLAAVDAPVALRVAAPIVAVAVDLAVSRAGVRRSRPAAMGVLLGAVAVGSAYLAVPDTEVPATVAGALTAAAVVIWAGRRTFPGAAPVVAAGLVVAVTVGAAGRPAAAAAPYATAAVGIAAVVALSPFWARARGREGAERAEGRRAAAMLEAAALALTVTVAVATGRWAGLGSDATENVLRAAVVAGPAVGALVLVRLLDRLRVV